jgi:ferredoxin
MKLPMLGPLLDQLRKEPATNVFPARYLPPSVTRYLEMVGKGEAVLHPPIPIPPRFKGRLSYNDSTCTGCMLCVKVCPAHALEKVPGKKKIRHIVCQCISCEQCTVVCAAGSLKNSDEFLTAGTDRYAPSMVLEG